MLEKLYALIIERKNIMPKGSYVSDLLRQGNDRIIQKVGEEAVEIVIAAKNNRKKEVVSEIADLLFHLLVMMANMDITLKDVYKELEDRRSRGSKEKS